MKRTGTGPPVWRDAQALRVAIEQAVRGFSHYHKYTLGTDLRRQAMTVCRLIRRAWRDREHTPWHLDALVDAVDDLKLRVQLAKELRAFNSFAEFQRIAEAAVAVGQQSGGWRRRVAGRQPESSGSRVGGVC